MELILVLASIFHLVAAFRGPHHPRSSVSHNHYVPVQSVKMTQDEELLHDTTHLAEDMGSLANFVDISKMDPQELEFYYFKLHDFDNNTKLDGLELLRALQHPLHSEEDHENDSQQPEQKDSDADYSWMIELIDRVLEEDDLDNDGYLGYTEFVVGRQNRDQENSARKEIKLI